MVLIIIAAVAGYYAASSGMSGSTVTTTVIGKTTLTSTVTVTSTIVGSGSGTTSSSSSSSSSSSAPTLPSSLPSLSNPISEAGSSLLFPLFQIWASNFTQMYSNVQVNTAAGGSGAGQTGVEQNTVNVGASDPFLSNAQVQAYPNILNIAVAVSAQ